MGCLQIILFEWQNYVDHHEYRSVDAYTVTVPVSENSRPGRPRFEITRAAPISPVNVIYLGTNCESS